MQKRASALLQRIVVTVLGPLETGHLSDEELLVRSSEEPPVQQSEVLLRAAHTQGQETAKEELMRTTVER
jgi:hypothetical protein